MKDESWRIAASDLLASMKAAEQQWLIVNE